MNQLTNEQANQPTSQPVSQPSILIATKISKSIFTASWPLFASDSASDRWVTCVTKIHIRLTFVKMLCCVDMWTLLPLFLRVHQHHHHKEIEYLYIHDFCQCKKHKLKMAQIDNLVVLQKFNVNFPTFSSL